MAASNGVGFQGRQLFSGNMNIAEKFGRWFVVGSVDSCGRILPAERCLRRGDGAQLPHAQSVRFARRHLHSRRVRIPGAAFGLTRHHGWARTLSFGLWAIFGYWDFGAMGRLRRRAMVSIHRFGDFLPRASLAAFVRGETFEDSRGAIRHT